MREFLSENYKYLFFVVGYLVSILIAWHWRNVSGIKSKSKLIIVYLIITVAGILGARFLGVIEKWMVGQDGGFRLFGSFFFMPPIMFLCVRWLRIKSRGFFDVVSLTILTTFFLFRINCYTQGCCEGIRLFGTGFKWPSRELELLFCIIAFPITWKNLDKDDLRGQLFPKLMIAYGLYRFVAEWFREGTNMGLGLHPAHFWAIICVILGSSVYGELRAQASKRKQNARQRRA